MVATGMTNGPDGVVRDVSPPDYGGDGDQWGQSLANSVPGPRAMESTTLAALVLLSIVATSDREKVVVATGRVLNLVCQLQQDHRDAQTDTTQRASLITSLSAALTGLRGAID
jgi:hypothetical protein